MTPEELKEIEERYSMSLKTFSLNNLAMLGVDVRGDILDLLAHIKELESQIPRWIPVEERLPEKEGIYLVYEPWVYGVNALWFVLGMDGLPNSTTKKEWETVTHWHPLPKGPEEA